MMAGWIHPRKNKMTILSDGHWWRRVDSPACGRAVPRLCRATGAAFTPAPLRIRPRRRKTATPDGVTVFLVEEGGFEPPKSVTTDLQSAPFGRSGTPPYSIGAGGRIRTPDLLITNQLLYQLSYTSESCPTAGFILADNWKFVNNFFHIFLFFKEA